ncbi:MAG: histidinol phosphate phosphatase domain-containing protein [Deltaproteobacteria bacterium]|nr:histidinol phosphate phosphatase domain-containing protein [Deltaproteobacteria bacterium]MBI5810604.1 histidinol phosphate phosphatase domain-containing protein [Deltaproteobacteria bacterium]
MIDFHTHSLISDGALLPSELARRAMVKGYRALAITDHADESNIEMVLKQIIKVSIELCRDMDITVLPGVELTHIPPSHIPTIVRKARRLGARVVVGHGETLAEPVARSTNMAFIGSKVDILAHPGLVTPAECALAKKNSVHFEITCRSGHSLSNGHVGASAKRHGVKMLINTDSHGPGDLISGETAEMVARGAGLGREDFKRILENAERLLEKTRL